MANRNGLNHKVRGVKGVGWNRALPAAFGFGNGIKPDGINDYMDVPRLVNYVLPDKLTIELWLYKDITINNGYIFSIYDDLKDATLNFNTNGSARLLRFDSQSGGLVGQSYWPESEDGLKAHCVWCIDKVENYSKFYLNGYLMSTMSSIAAYAPNYIKSINFFRYYTGTLNSNALVDEFRIYSKVLREDQIVINYNSGVGNNPCVTEYLLLWYNFDKIESLDFSPLLDKSLIGNGVRDLSGNDNHARLFNMDVTPTSSSFVLKPF
ncbi:LamG-like jellyroll fold domain-containing protein [Mucilaginibacter auburnensis]|uniref:Concanavalin A-like lectin/glucanase superfamily protein n=1 Tax=Mucilaginibacter auburnensis TaxID=1457233 RepID=A0A2H9VNQ5_9SPHI|nr:LamG-like jellyroll fold domain-containing protein [Mucilaginibacter auburnensis]PJJ79974.1 concanavalin A-like lectin/glucanase superfamily protein [Mucilaginibacter auburnensis]